jgi:hypothetical protein
VRCYWELFGEHVRNLGANFDLTPQKTCMENRLSPVQVESGQSILHTKHNVTTNPHPNKQKRVAPSLHDMTSEWLYGNSFSKIGFHYFWSGLLEVIMEQNDPQNRHS